MKSIGFFIFVISVLTLSCNKDSSSMQSNAYKSDPKNNKEGQLKSRSSFNVCTDPEPSTLYLYSYGARTFYITPKLDGSSGTEAIVAGGLSCFDSAVGYDCDGAPSWTGVCCLTINNSINCTGNVYQVNQYQTYTVTPYVPVTSPCIGSSFTFEIDCTGEIQSIRFCSSECFTKMCYSNVDCFEVHIYN